MIGRFSVRAAETSSKQRSLASEAREAKNTTALALRMKRVMVSSQSAPPGMFLSNQTVMPRAFRASSNGTTAAESRLEYEAQMSMSSAAPVTSNPASPEHNGEGESRCEAQREPDGNPGRLSPIRTAEPSPWP